MQRPAHLFLGVFALGFVGMGAIASAALSKPTGSQVKFTAVGPAGLKIEGSTTQIDIVEEKDTISVTVPLTSLSTGIDLRDKHMKEDLEVATYPTAQFTVQRSSITFPAAGEAKSGDVPGTLKLHGKSVPATVHYEATSDKGNYAIKGKLHINMSDVGIKVRSYMGVSVKPDVDVAVNFQIAGS